MDIQQIVEMLSQMEANRKADQAKIEANMKEDKEETKALREVMQANQAKAEGNMKTQISSLASEMKADWDAHMQEVVAKTVSVIEEKMEAIVHPIRSEWDGKIQRRIENVLGAWQEEMVASLECKEQGPKELESGAKCQMVPTKDAIGKSVRGRKKRQRGQHIAAGRRVKPTKLTRGDCESRRKLVATCRKVSLRAAVAWHRRNIFRDIWTQGNCGPWQELGAAGIRVTLRAKLARRTSWKVMIES
jgi:hypothetical protein